MKDKSLNGNLGLQHFAEMPTNCLAFAIFVRREVQFVGLLQQILELRDLLLLVCGYNIHRLEVIIDIDTQVGPVFFLELVGHLSGAAW